MKAMKAMKVLRVLLLSLAAFGLFTMMVSPHLYGIAPRSLGLFAVMVGMVVALSLLVRTSREHLQDASPAEWKAWIGTGCMLAGVTYFLLRMSQFAAVDWRDPQVGAVSRTLVLLLVGWSVLSSTVAARWKGQVEEDERDREIAARAVAWGRGALVFCLIGIAVMLGFSPPERLQWATHFMIANLLVFALMWHCLVEYAATTLMYLRDRRAAA